MDKESPNRWLFVHSPGEKRGAVGRKAPFYQEFSYVHKAGESAANLTATPRGLPIPMTISPRRAKIINATVPLFAAACPPWPWGDYFPMK